MMRDSYRRVCSAATSVALLFGSFAAASAVLVSQAPRAAAATPFTPGDVFVSVFNSTVEEHKPDGTLVQSFSSGFGGENDGSTFDKNGNLFVTDGFSNNTVSKFDNSGNFLGTFGSGYNEHPESIVFDAAGNAYVGQADGSHQILKFNPSGTLLASYSPATESRGTDWIDLLEDGCTIQYTSEGTSIKQFNVCTNTQLADFATGLPGSNAYAHRHLPDGTVLVADTDAVRRVNSSGTILQTYTPAESVSLLFAMNLDPDGKTFWTADYISGEVFRFDIATGAELSHWSAGTGQGASGISVLGEITSVPKITLSPASATNPVGATHTLTATATDNGAPASGKTVTFKVLSGPNAGLTGTATTNTSGVATFSYSSTKVGTDSIQASFVAASGSTVTSNTVTKTWVSGSAPTCVLTGVVAGPPKQIQITVQDTSSGLASVSVTTHNNATVSVPSFTAGTKTAVVVTATKTNQTLPSQVALQVKDVNGNTTNCDPLLATLHSGASASATLDSAEHYVLVTNGSPGLAAVTVSANGRAIGVSLDSGARRLVDIGSTLHSGANNVTVTGGSGSGSAGVLVWDGSGTP